MSKKRTRCEAFDDEAYERLVGIVEFDDTYDEVEKLVATIEKAGNDIIDARRDSLGYALLHRAVMRGKTEVVELLLRSGANPDVAVEVTPGADPKDRVTEIGCTALLYTTTASMAELLLSWNANVDALDSWGETPFDRCVDFDDHEMARFFLDRSKNILAGDGHPKKFVTTGCALAMKIAKLEMDADDADDATRASGFRDLLPDFAKRTNTDAIFADMRSYGKVHVLDQQPRVYAILVGLETSRV